MQAEITMYEAQKKKMQGLCEEHDLIYRFRKDQYPITFTVRPVQGIDAQMSMLENAEEEGYISPNASMTWVFRDGVLETKVTGGTFTISKTLRTKIESVLMKMITYWQQYFFRDVLERGALIRGSMPVIDEEDAEEDEDDTEPEDEDEDDDSTDGETFELSEDDEKVKEATRIVRMENKASVGLLQRRMNIGYAEATMLIDTLETLGVVGSFQGSSPREVLPYDVPDGATEA